jgi:hypothetical protein
MLSGNADDYLDVFLAILKWLGVAVIALGSLIYRRMQDDLEKVKDRQADMVTREDLKEFKEEIAKLIELEFKARFGA